MVILLKGDIPHLFLSELLDIIINAKSWKFTYLHHNQTDNNIMQADIICINAFQF